MNCKDDELREEYPEELIKSGERGKCAKPYREGTNRDKTAGEVRK